MSEAADFLEKLRPSGPWILTAIVPDGVTETITATTPSEVDAFVASYNGKRNLYYTLNLTDGAKNKKPSKLDITAVEYLHADLDPEPGESSEAAKARYLEKLASFEPPPTAIVDSGNGIQAKWKLSERILIDSPEYITDVEARNKALTLRLGGKAGTQNVDRILRLPGTTHLPNAKKRKDGRVECPARLIMFNGAVAPLDAFPREQAKQEQKADNQKRESEAGEQKRLPRELTNMLHLRGEKPSDYPSRSHLLWAFLIAAMSKGVDENDIVQACLDPAFEGCSIHDHVEENGGRDYVKRQIERSINQAITTDEGKRIIRVKRGKRFEAWRELQRAMMARQDKCQVFVRGNKLVEPLWRWETDDDGSETLVAQFMAYNALRLSDVIARHAVEFWRVEGKKQVLIDPPNEVIETLLTRGDWDFPTVVGIINTPTMRPDGTLLITPGYDPATRLWYKPAADIRLPPIPEKPTNDQAKEALAKLNSLLDGFPFSDEVSRSVALAAMLTPVLRGAIQVVPIFAVVAPDPRTGKTYLVHLIGVLATGHKPVATAGSRKPEEFEKRIETAALSGRSILHLNNLPNGMMVESEGLSQMSTENQIYIRKLGRHEEGLCNCRGTTIFMNGNNIIISADLVPRTPICRLDAKMEQPGSRKFEFDPIERVRRERGTYLAAIFTIVKAFMAAGSPEQTDRIRIAGYDDWSRLVQQPLLWLGQADPLGGIEDARAMDPTIEELSRLIDVLKKYFPPGTFFSVSDCERLAEEQERDPIAGYPRYKRQDLRDLMSPHGKINTKAFGWLLKRHMDRMFDGWCLRVSKGKDRNSYYLDGPAALAAAQSQEEAGEDPEVM